MEARNLAKIKISFDTAKRMFMQGSEFEREVALKTWPELGKKALPTCLSEMKANLRIEQANALDSLGALIIARDIYRDGNEAGLDWGLIHDKRGSEWCAVKTQWELHLWSFQDQETAKLFLENFKDKLNIIKNLY